MKVRLIKTKWKIKVIFTKGNNKLVLKMDRPYLTFAPLLYYIMTNGKHTHRIVYAGGFVEEYETDMYSIDMREDQILILLEPNPKPKLKESKLIKDLNEFLQVVRWTKKLKNGTKNN